MPKANYALASFAATVNDLDPRLPKSRGVCFDVGTWGGCGPSCPAFVGGDCDEPQEISPADIVSEHGREDAMEIMGLYPCFSGVTLANGEGD